MDGSARGQHQTTTSTGYIGARMSRRNLPLRLTRNPAEIEFTSEVESEEEEDRWRKVPLVNTISEFND